MSRFTLLLLLAILLQGCVAAGPKKDQETVFYPALPQQPRLQFLTSLSNENDLGKSTGGFQAFLSGEQQTGSLGRVHSVGVRPGKLYVGDLAFGQVMIVDFAKKEIVPFKAEREATLREPMGLVVAADGRLYVADAGRRQVVVFDENDSFAGVYGTGNLERPLDVAAHDNRIYVADFSEHRVQVFDRDSGELVQTIGERGTEPGQFDRPTHVRVDRLGNLYVNDSFNYRIQKFDHEGNYQHHFGYLGAALAGFTRPKGLAISPAGHLYVADAGYEMVQVFNDEDQHLLLFFGGFGDGQGYMYLPSAVAIDDKNMKEFNRYVDKDFEVEYLLYVGNLLGNHKINVYGFGKWIGAALPETTPSRPRN